MGFFNLHLARRAGNSIAELSQINRFSFSIVLHFFLLHFLKYETTAMLLRQRLKLPIYVISMNLKILELQETYLSWDKPCIKTQPSSSNTFISSGQQTATVPD